MIVCHTITIVITSQGFRDELKSFTCIKALIRAANHKIRSCLLDSVHCVPWGLETQFFWVGSYGGGPHRIHSAHGESQEMMGTELLWKELLYQASIVTL